MAGIDSFTKLLLHMDDTGLTDEMSNPITLHGDAVRSNTRSKFGGYSGYFDGTGDHLTLPYTADFILGNNDWTLDAWFNSNSFAGQQGIVSKDTWGTSFDWCIAITNTTTITLATNKGTQTLIVTVPTMSTDVWYHVAIVRYSGTNTIYLNGIDYGSNAMSITNISQTQITVGCLSWNNPNDFFNGYIDELRISKGIARWIENFTPPIGPYNGAGDVPATPTNFKVIILESGDSEIVLSWDSIEYTDYYDIYYSTDPNVTKETGTKIGNITNTSYNHQDLTRGTYYYIIIAVNETGESITSDEINYTVIFEGKIFNHTEQIRNNLLYQYQDN